MTARRPVQIASSSNATDEIGNVFVLCGDGSLWVGWVRSADPPVPTNEPLPWQWRRLPAIPEDQP